MDEFNDYINDLDLQIKACQQGTTFQSVTPAAEAALKKAKSKLEQARGMLSQIKANQKQQAQDKLKQRENTVSQLEQQQMTAKGQTVEYTTTEQQTAQKLKSGVLYLDDAKKNAQEAIITGENIVNSIANQNKRMETIGDRTTNIQNNVVKSDQILNELKKKEAAVTWILYGLCVLMLGSCGLAFYLFHKN